MIRLLVLAFACMVFVGSALAIPPPVRVKDEVIMSDAYPEKLSDFGFFSDFAAKMPVEEIMRYDLNSALFSDYADKIRYIYIPSRQQAQIGENGRMLFPVGSAIIKHFGYDDGEGGTDLIETRVLLHRAGGWVALPYVWNEHRTEAFLKVGGKRVPVTFTNPSGETQQISYAVPNLNQCKGCHALNDKIMPIGPKLRNLDKGSQIQAFQSRGWLPADLEAYDVMPDYSDEKFPLDDRARAYLDINCAHCHNRQGPASNSGLFLGYEETDRIALGIGKRPVAAGRGSGGRDFSIAPGQPEKSIMIYRLGSTDPGIAMPELGRSTNHKEGIELLSKWIAAMPERAESRK